MRTYLNVATALLTASLLLGSCPAAVFAEAGSQPAEAVEAESAAAEAAEAEGFEDEEVFAEWNPDAPALNVLTDYVEDITDEDSDNYIPVENRIAVFDMDGTLYAELFPTYLEYYALAWRILKDPTIHPDAEMLEVGRTIRDSALDGSFPEDMPMQHAIQAARAYAGMTLDEFSDFVTAYTGVGYTDIDSQEYIYVSEGVDDKLTYNLGANPFMQYGTASTKKQMALNILRKLKNIAYTPFRTGYLNTPAYDLGDVIQNTEGIADNSYCCVMWFEYNFSTGIQVEGFGQNPALATARNKTEKEMAGIMSKTDKNSIQMYTFKNVEEQVIADGQTKELMNIRFATMEAKQVTFQAEILCETDADEVIGKIQYYLNNAEITDYQPVETWSEDGKHIISLYYMIDVEPQQLYQWSVRLNSDGGTITVPVENARGTIWGQGLVTNAVWDGFIDVEDTFSGIPINDSISIDDFLEEIDVDVITPIVIEAEDGIEVLDIDDGIEIAPFNDLVLMNRIPLYYDSVIWEDVYENTWGAMYDGYTW